MEKEIRLILQMAAKILQAVIFSGHKGQKSPEILPKPLFPSQLTPLFSVFENRKTPGFTPRKSARPPLSDDWAAHGVPGRLLPEQRLAVLLPGAGRQGRVVLRPACRRSVSLQPGMARRLVLRSFPLQRPAPCRMNFAEECKARLEPHRGVPGQYNSRVRIGKPAPGRQSRDEVKIGAEWALGTLPPASKYAPSYSRGISRPDASPAQANPAAGSALGGGRELKRVLGFYKKLIYSFFYKKRWMATRFLGERKPVFCLAKGAFHHLLLDHEKY